MKWWLLLISIIFPILSSEKKAIVIVPVADLLGKPSPCTLPRQILHHYQQLPICGKNNFHELRIHQLLFNEIVTIEEEHGIQVRVSVPNVFYQGRKNDQIHTSYWALKKNFSTFKQLQEKKIDVAKLPNPISFYEQQTDQPIITLKYPYYCSQLNVTFSAGTRFVVTEQKKSGPDITVFVLNPHKLTMTIMAIPKELCIETIPETATEKISLFLSILRQYANNQNGFIPYVWGGSSYIKSCSTEEFIEKKEGANSYYVRPDCTFRPFSGFDCSGLIWRIAQMCEIPFYFKNSYTIAEQLQQIKSDEPLHEGDIIWFQGHVIIISNLKKNLLIEARAYAHGYGKIHEIPICAAFKDINTFTELLKAYEQNQFLERLNKKNGVVQTIPNFKILKLSSVWQQPKYKANKPN